MKSWVEDDIKAVWDFDSFLSIPELSIMDEPCSTPVVGVFEI